MSFSGFSVEMIQLTAVLISVVLAVTIHEFFHAATAYLLGDPTAKYAGRLSLNPLKHFSLWGSLIFLFTILFFRVGIGWGKPVPFNPYNLKSQKWGPVLVALSGPFSNFLLAVMVSLPLRFLPISFLRELNPSWFILFLSLVQVNIVLMIFNLFPVPPLDGSKLLALALAKKPQIWLFLERNGLLLLVLIILLGGNFIVYLVQLLSRLLLGNVMMLI